MTREEIIMRADECGGAWEPIPGVVIKPRKLTPEKNDPDGVMAYVTIKAGNEEEIIEFWLMGHYNEATNFFAQGLRGLDHSAMVFDAAKLLAAAIDYDMPESDLKVVEKQVRVVDKAAEEHLAGKIEAYEKILIGRSISASA